MEAVTEVGSAVGSEIDSDAGWRAGAETAGVSPTSSSRPAVLIGEVAPALSEGAAPDCRHRLAQVLAITGARGGLGASVLLLHLAWALSRAGRRVAMMDLDPAGGLDLLCGESVLSGLRWADLPVEESAFRPGHLVGALPVWHAMPVLTGDIRGGPSRCAGAALEAMRAEHDVVLVDLPRGAPPPPGACVLLLTALDLPLPWRRRASSRGCADLSQVDTRRLPAAALMTRAPGRRCGSWCAREVRTSLPRTLSSSPAARCWARFPLTGS